MAEHEFTIVMDGKVTDEAIEALYEAGCDDATFGVVDGVHFADFAREGDTLLGAILTAVRDIQSVDGLRARRVEPDDLVTASEIAERLGRSRESVRLLAAGERGGGDFPPPVSHLRTRNRLWRWSDIAAWAGDATVKADADVIAAVNAVLELQAQGHLEEHQGLALLSH